MRPIPLLALALFVAAGPAFGEGEFEIDQACVAVGCFPGDAPGFPVTLANDGAYRLTSDLTVTGGLAVNGIEIAASRIDLDLGGFTVNGGGQCILNPGLECSGAVAGRGIVQNGAGTLLRIHDGAVVGMGSGGIVAFSLNYGSSFENLTVLGNAGGLPFVVSDAGANVPVQMRGIRCVRNQGNCGIFNNGARLQVSDSVFSENETGLIVGYGSVVTDCLFARNIGFGLSGANGGTQVAFGRNYFSENNGSEAAAQYSIGQTRDMGHNVCGDGSCP
ncbi:MAG: hypothetical protein KA505_04820 [Xanthomonadales bacterium]|nr:hypothetical protein [Xanthomonadales bacterium]MBP7623462.1 hypothetical protein [Xanthomonadales bacterium]